MPNRRGSGENRARSIDPEQQEYFHACFVGNADMPSDTVPFPKEFKSATRDIGLSDARIAEDTHHAAGQMQDAMDAALMAGLIVEPSFSLIENRQTPWGARLDSFVRNIRIYRRLTEKFANHP